jgi:hypothetical protein
MELTPYVESLRAELLAVADSGEARALAERLTAAVASASRLTMLEVLSAAADEVTRDLAPGSVEIRLRGRDPYFVVTAPDVQEDRAGTGTSPQVGRRPEPGGGSPEGGTAIGGPTRDGATFGGPTRDGATIGGPTRDGATFGGRAQGGATFDGYGAEMASGSEVVAPALAAEAGEGPVARINFRPPEQLKQRIEAAAAAEGLSVNAWLVRVTSAAVSAPPPNGGSGSHRRGRRDSGGGGRFVGWVG